MKELNHLNALIIEPHQGMRASLHNMLNLCEITKIDHAVSAGAAIRLLYGKRYDIILCGYDLGDGQDGQQLLEDLRQNRIIPLSTLFVMVTAERSYEKVVSAAEFAPSDYLLKPFTADKLMERLIRAAERRALFMPVYDLMDQGDIAEAIKLCERSEMESPRLATDFMRIRAELFITSGQLDKAGSVYEQIFLLKELPWARLGLAKTYFLQQRFAEAEEILIALIADNSQYLDAYDWLAKTQQANGKLAQAKVVLESAVSISPHAVRRLRKLGEVALEVGDIEIAERSFEQVVSKARYSEFRDPEDHVHLVETLVSHGNTQQAASVIRDMEKTLGSSPKTAACSAFSSALMHQANGDTELAIQQLNTAVEACRDSAGLSNQLKMMLAKNCLDNELEQGASEVMLDVMNNSAEHAVIGKAMALFEQAGKKELAEAIAKESRRQVVELVASGAEKARQGDFAGAVELMTQAASRMPDNPQVIFNAAVAVLKCLENSGWDSRLGEQGKVYIEHARHLDAANPKLMQLGELYVSILKKYGVSMTPLSIKSRVTPR